MFRKPKRTVKSTNYRSKNNDDNKDDTTTSFPVKDDDDSNDLSSRRKDNNDIGDCGDDNDTNFLLLQNAKKRAKVSSSSSKIMTTTTTTNNNNKNDVLQTYQISNDTDDATKRHKDLVTSTCDHHPINTTTTTESGDAGTVGFGEDGIFRNTLRNKMYAGPIRAAQHVRVTARFDYQPDICKDYKQTGFCGYGDSCIYLHDRGDTLSGWQIDLRWQEQQQQKRTQQETDISNFITQQQQQSSSTTNDDSTNQKSVVVDDGIPFACYLCRKHFTNPVVTKCHHYFCESCIMNHVRGQNAAATTATADASCPICGIDTASIFNVPTKLIAKKKKVLGITSERRSSTNANDNDSWEAYYNAMAR